MHTLLKVTSGIVFTKKKSYAEKWNSYFSDGVRLAVVLVELYEKDQREASAHPKVGPFLALTAAVRGSHRVTDKANGRRHIMVGLSGCL